MSNSATRSLESVALKFSSELNAVAEDLANYAHRWIDGGEIYEGILSAWQTIGDIHEEYSAEIDNLYSKYFELANLGA